MNSATPLKDLLFTQLSFGVNLFVSLGVVAER